MFLRNQLLILLYLIVCAANQVMFKKVAIGPGGISYFALWFDPLFYGCCFIFLIQTAIWLTVIRCMPLTKAYPFTSLNVVITLLIAALFFGETITLSNVLGAIVIVGGVVIIAKEKTTTEG